MKNKRIITLVLTIFFLLSLQIVAFAGTSWSDARTFALDSGTSWKTETTLGDTLKNTKTTDSTEVAVYTVSKSMWSKPVFRMVNSDNQARSGEITTADAGRFTTSKTNTGEVGYGYYASMKAAWNQISNSQSIRIQFKSY